MTSGADLVDWTLKGLSLVLLLSVRLLSSMTASALNRGSTLAFCLVLPNVEKPGLVVDLGVDLKKIEDYDM